MARRRMPTHTVKTKAKADPQAPLGSGGRFEALKDKLSNQPGINDPSALAASIGRKKYGQRKMTSFAVNGR